MEPRGQEKPNQESSSKPSIISTLADRRNESGHGSSIFSPNQTLDQHHQFNVQQQQQRHGREPNPDPDPAQLASPTIASAPNSMAVAPPPPPPPLSLPPQSTTTAVTNSIVSIRYRECLKNHAASMGGHVIDGCGEFMPNGEEGTLEALKCAACECHRNFHRREVEGESAGNCYNTYNYNPNPNNSQRTTIHPTQAPPPPLYTLPPHHHHHHHRHPVPPTMVAFGRSGGGAPAESSSEDLNMFQSNARAQPPVQPPFSVSRKRFRTKFNRDQKDKMREFAEKLGWKIQKQDEQQVQQFCNELGVKRQVFKVWMHNNKQAMKKTQLDFAAILTKNHSKSKDGQTTKSIHNGGMM